jgi:S1-C subfamily serine protease
VVSHASLLCTVLCLPTLPQPRPTCPVWKAFILGCTLLCALRLNTAAAATAQLWTEPTTPRQAHPLLQGLNTALVALTQHLLPAVVSLRVYPKDGDLPKNHPPLPDGTTPFGTGSGFIIRADGLIVTNYHVIENSKTIEVHLHGGDMVQAQVLGEDPSGDLALLQIPTERPLPVAPLGNSASLQVGELVVAIGSPFGFEHTITLGIISAKQRHFLHSGIVGGFIQTDASINTGNSGGPLINMHGEVVGVNTAMVGRGELGFAIPVDAVKAVLPQLYTAQQVTRGWLGVQIRPLDQEKAKALGMLPPRGVYVHDVLNDQPAQRAGILAGDIILRFDGQKIRTPFELQSLVAATPVGKKVQVELFRKQAKHELELVIGTMPKR